MQKFLALYMATPEAMERWQQMSEEDQKQGMDAWNAWSETHASDFTDPGTPLGPNVRVVKDGTSSQTNAVGGYSIVQAESAEAAAAIFEDCPHFEEADTYVDLMPLMDM